MNIPLTPWRKLREPHEYVSHERVALSFGFRSIELVRQFAKDGEVRTWSDLYFGVCLWTWRWGLQHIWYDGPHCALCIGWIHFCWEGNPFTGRCKKCEGVE